MTVPGDPADLGPPADVTALLGELATLKSELLTLQREQQRELDRYRVEVAAEREERAEQARAGEFGRAWQTRQHRADLGETGPDAVVPGGDDFSQAEVVRGRAHANTEVLSAELDSEIAEAEEGHEPTPAAEDALRSRAIAAELQAQLTRLQTLRFPTP